MKKALELTVPILENFRPVLHNLDPFLGTWVSTSRSCRASSQTSPPPRRPPKSRSDLSSTAAKAHALTAMQVLSPESLAVYPNRIGTNRGDAYPHSGAYSSLASGLPVFSSSSCSNSAPSVEGPANETVSEELIKLLTHPSNSGESPVANEPNTANRVAAPGCTQQGPFTFNGETSQFPHIAYKEK